MCVTVFANSISPSSSIREGDEALLLALAGVHCPDPDLRARLNYTFMRRTLTAHK